MEDVARSSKLRKLFFGKLNRKIIFSFSILLVIILLSNYFSFQISYNTLENSIGKKSALLAQEVMNEIDRTIYYRIEDFQAYSTDLLLKENILKSNQEFDNFTDAREYINQKDKEWISVPKEEVTPFMKQLIENELSKELLEKINFYNEKYGYKVFGEVFITNKHGANIAQTRKTSDYKQNDEDWWQNAKKYGLHVADVEYDRSAGVYSVDISIRINDENGVFLGVMKVVLNIEEVINIIKQLESSEENEIHDNEEHKTMKFKLLTNDGKVIYSTDDFKIFEETNEDLLLVFKEKEKEHIHYFIGKCINHDGNCLFSHSNSDGYKDFKGLGWILIIEHESEEVITPLNNLSIILFVIFLVAGIIISIIGYNLSRKISRPIKELHEATEKVEKGNFNVRVDIKTGDELEQLGNAFNKTTEALKTMDEEHKQLEKAKTEFLSITSHELRSPMTPMRGQLQMLLEEYFGKINKKQKEALKIVLRNTERLDKIIKDFLEISRIETARLKFNFIKTDTVKYINHVVEEMKNFMPEKGIQIVTSIDKLPVIEVDPDRIMQVLRNLINNAIKFSPRDTKVWVNAEQKYDMILFSVKDQGIGISHENQKKIFEPFFQEEQTIYRRYGGTGLGLTICKGIVESQGGNLWVESKKDKGSTFYFTVPLKPIKKVKPIRLLFSSQENVEKKVENLFKEILGVMGSTEFKKLKDRNELKKENLLSYIGYLIKNGIITKKTGEIFKNNINEIFESESVSKNKL